MIRHPVRLMRMVLIAVLSFSVTAAAGTLGWWAILNSLGPSTEYHSPYIEGPDGKLLPQENGAYVAHLGERIYVRYFIVRHKINGDCLLHVYRYGENIGGPEAGKRHLLDYVELQFRGEDELLRPRWPIRGLVLGYGVHKNGSMNLGDPLIPPGLKKQELALYVVARYRCNPLDYFFPRYLQGGVKPNETERAYLIVRRKQ